VETIRDICGDNKSPLPLFLYQPGDDFSGVAVNIEDRDIGTKLGGPQGDTRPTPAPPPVTKATYL
jgi:hypothetical protein